MQGSWLWQPRAALLALHTHRMVPVLLLDTGFQPFAPSPGLLWPLLTSPAPSGDIVAALFRFVRRDREISACRGLTPPVIHAMPGIPKGGAPLPVRPLFFG